MLNMTGQRFSADTAVARPIKKAVFIQFFFVIDRLFPFWMKDKQNRFPVAGKPSGSMVFPDDFFSAVRAFSSVHFTMLVCLPD